MCNQFVQSVRPPGKHLVDNRRRVVFVFACCAGPEPEPRTGTGTETSKKPGAGAGIGTTVKFEWFRIPGRDHRFGDVTSAYVYTHERVHSQTFCRSKLVTKGGGIYIPECQFWGSTAH